MRKVKVYSFSISKEVVDRLDSIVDACAKEGVTITRSKIVNVLLDSQTMSDTCSAWTKYFCAEDEYLKSLRGEINAE